jgi:hypothetical protein
MEKGAAMGSFEPVFEYVALVIDLVGISMILWGFSLSFKDWLILEMRKGETISFFSGHQPNPMSVGNIPADGVRVYDCIRYYSFFYFSISG